jgi:hypothetical protein
MVCIWKYPFMRFFADLYCPTGREGAQAQPCQEGQYLLEHCPGELRSRWVLFKNHSRDFHFEVHIRTDSCKEISIQSAH